MAKKLFEVEVTYVTFSEDTAVVEVEAETQEEARNLATAQVRREEMVDDIIDADILWEAEDEPTDEEGEAA